MLALVTGGSKGIGFEIVKRLAREPDICVVAVARNTESLLKLASKQKNNSKIIPVKADISNALQLKEITRFIRSLKKPLDILVNNAGLFLSSPFEKITHKEMVAVYETNVFAPFMLINALLPFMNQKNGTHVVNIGSMGGVQGSAKFPGLSVYSSSKSALAGLTECLAEELKPKKITVNCLALGAVQTEMLSKAFPGYKAPVTAAQSAEFISHFALTGHKHFNGKIIQVSSATP